MGYNTAYSTWKKIKLQMVRSWRDQAHFILFLCDHVRPYYCLKILIFQSSSPLENNSWRLALKAKAQGARWCIAGRVKKHLSAKSMRMVSER
jgi:hypothetical protein